MSLPPVSTIEKDPEFATLTPYEKRQVMDAYALRAQKEYGFSDGERQFILNKLQARYPDPTPEQAWPTQQAWRQAGTDVKRGVTPEKHVAEILSNPNAQPMEKQWVRHGLKKKWFQPQVATASLPPTQAEQNTYNPPIAQGNTFLEKAQDYLSQFSRHSVQVASPFLKRLEEMPDPNLAAPLGPISAETARMLEKARQQEAKNPGHFVGRTASILGQNVVSMLTDPLFHAMTLGSIYGGPIVGAAARGLGASATTAAKAGALASRAAGAGMAAGFGVPLASETVKAAEEGDWPRVTANSILLAPMALGLAHEVTGVRPQLRGIEAEQILRTAAEHPAAGPDIAAAARVLTQRIHEGDVAPDVVDRANALLDLVRKRQMAQVPQQRVEQAGLAETPAAFVPYAEAEKLSQRLQAIIDNPETPEEIRQAAQRMTRYAAPEFYGTPAMDTARSLATAAESGAQTLPEEFRQPEAKPKRDSPPPKPEPTKAPATEFLNDPETTPNFPNTGARNRFINAVYKAIDDGTIDVSDRLDHAADVAGRRRETVANGQKPDDALLRDMAALVTTPEAAAKVDEYYTELSRGIGREELPSIRRRVESSISENLAMRRIAAGDRTPLEGGAKTLVESIAAKKAGRGSAQAPATTGAPKEAPATVQPQNVESKAGVPPQEIAAPAAPAVVPEAAPPAVAPEVAPAPVPETKPASQKRARAVAKAAEQPQPVALPVQEQPRAQQAAPPVQEQPAQVAKVPATPKQRRARAAKAGQQAPEVAQPTPQPAQQTPQEAVQQAPAQPVQAAQAAQQTPETKTKRARAQAKAKQEQQTQPAPAQAAQPQQEQAAQQQQQEQPPATPKRVRAQAKAKQHEPQPVQEQVQAETNTAQLPESTHPVYRAVANARGPEGVTSTDMSAVARALEDKKITEADLGSLTRAKLDELVAVEARKRSKRVPTALVDVVRNGMSREQEAWLRSRYEADYGPADEAEVSFDEFVAEHAPRLFDLGIGNPNSPTISDPTEYNGGKWIDDIGKSVKNLDATPDPSKPAYKREPYTGDPNKTDSPDFYGIYIDPLEKPSHDLSNAYVRHNGVWYRLKRGNGAIRITMEVPEEPWLLDANRDLRLQFSVKREVFEHVPLDEKPATPFITPQRARIREVLGAILQAARSGATMEVFRGKKDTGQFYGRIGGVWLNLGRMKEGRPVAWTIIGDAEPADVGQAVEGFDIGGLIDLTPAYGAGAPDNWIPDGGPVPAASIGTPQPGKFLAARDRFNNRMYIISGNRVFSAFPDKASGGVVWKPARLLSWRRSAYDIRTLDSLEGIDGDTSAITAVSPKRARQVEAEQAPVQATTNERFVPSVAEPGVVVTKPEQAGMADVYTSPLKTKYAVVNGQLYESTPEGTWKAIDNATQLPAAHWVHSYMPIESFTGETKLYSGMPFTDLVNKIAKSIFGAYPSPLQLRKGEGRAGLVSIRPTREGLASFFDYLRNFFVESASFTKRLSPRGLDSALRHEAVAKTVHVHMEHVIDPLIKTMEEKGVSPDEWTFHAIVLRGVSKAAELIGEGKTRRGYAVIKNFGRMVREWYGIEEPVAAEGRKSLAERVMAEFRLVNGVLDNYFSRPNVAEVTELYKEKVQAPILEDLRIEAGYSSDMGGSNNALGLYVPAVPDNSMLLPDISIDPNVDPVVAERLTKAPYAMERVPGTIEFTGRAKSYVTDLRAILRTRIYGLERAVSTRQMWQNFINDGVVRPVWQYFGTGTMRDGGAVDIEIDVTTVKPNQVPKFRAKTVRGYTTLSAERVASMDGVNYQETLSQFAPFDGTITVNGERHNATVASLKTFGIPDEELAALGIPDMVVMPSQVEYDISQAFKNAEPSNKAWTKTYGPLISGYLSGVGEPIVHSMTLLSRLALIRTEEAGIRGQLRALAGPLNAVKVAWDMMRDWKHVTEEEWYQAKLIASHFGVARHAVKFNPKRLSTYGGTFLYGDRGVFNLAAVEIYRFGKKVGWTEEEIGDAMRQLNAHSRTLEPRLQRAMRYIGLASFYNTGMTSRRTAFAHLSAQSIFAWFIWSTLPTMITDPEHRPWWKIKGGRPGDICVGPDSAGQPVYINLLQLNRMMNYQSNVLKPLVNFFNNVWQGVSQRETKAAKADAMNDALGELGKETALLTHNFIMQPVWTGPIASVHSAMSGQTIGTWQLDPHNPFPTPVKLYGHNDLTATERAAAAIQGAFPTSRTIMGGEVGEDKETAPTGDLMTWLNHALSLAGQPKLHREMMRKNPTMRGIETQMRNITKPPSLKVKF